MVDHEKSLGNQFGNKGPAISKRTKAKSGTGEGEVEEARKSWDSVGDFWSCPLDRFRAEEVEEDDEFAGIECKMTRACQKLIQ